MIESNAKRLLLLVLFHHFDHSKVVSFGCACLPFTCVSDAVGRVSEDHVGFFAVHEFFDVLRVGGVTAEEAMVPRIQRSPGLVVGSSGASGTSSGSVLPSSGSSSVYS